MIIYFALMIAIVENGCIIFILEISTKNSCGSICSNDCLATKSTNHTKSRGANCATYGCLRSFIAININKSPLSCLKNYDMVSNMKICKIDSCKNPHQGLGFCNMHYIRFKKHGNPLKKTRNERGEGTLSHGYLRITKNGKTKTLHRLIMEKIIGRKLSEKEIVHHINENKLDNRPENLQIMSKSFHQFIHHVTTFRNKTHKQCTNCRKIRPRWQFLKTSQPGKFRDPHRPTCKDCFYSSL